MPITNTRIWEAAKFLATTEDDIRFRVAGACNILQSISNYELELFPLEIKTKIQSLLKETGKNGPEYHLFTNEVLNNKFTNTARSRKKSTYVKFANDIFSLNETINNGR